MSDYDWIQLSDEVDHSVIYSSPETSWTWSYDFPDYNYKIYQGVTEEIIENLGETYTTCWAGLGDIGYWSGVVFGDLYGNRGINTSLYYLWNIIAFKLP
mmetsp:Transcript_32937/g.50367  ORF Transcript_32937/g.50367 Transcript_32937/m.50367 type:complete len:99 (+) Transcript_32937:171-467(+)